MMKLSDLRTSEEVLAGALRDPAFRAEWERTAVARALASQVVAYRVKHGLSQRALADELHMSQPQVARLEAAIHNPEIETLRRVASVLDVEFDLKIPQRQEPTLSSRPSAKAASRRSPSRAPETGVRDSDDLPKEWMFDSSRVENALAVYYDSLIKEGENTPYLRPYLTGESRPPEVEMPEDWDESDEFPKEEELTKAELPQQVDLG